MAALTAVRRKTVSLGPERTDAPFAQRLPSLGQRMASVNVTLTLLLFPLLTAIPRHISRSNERAPDTRRGQENGLAHM